MSRSKTLFASLAALAALALGGSAIAGAVDNNGNTDQNGSQQQQQQQRGHDGDGRGPHGPGGPGMGETPLTGDTAAKVKAAAEAKVDGGTVLRTETDRGGDYEAHVRTKDGQEVVVKVDKSFKVTGTETLGQGGPHGGPQGQGGQQGVAYGAPMTTQSS